MNSELVLILLLLAALALLAYWRRADIARLCKKETGRPAPFVVLPEQPRQAVGPVAFISPCHEDQELGGGRHRMTAHLRPVAFWKSGSLARIHSDFADGDANWPNVVTEAPMLLYTAADGMRRICPTRDPAKYIEIGAPYIKPATAWQKVGLNPFLRAGNVLTSVNANVDVSVTMAGHFCKLEAALKNGYVPPNGQVAFPVGLSGLAWDKNTIRDGANPVASIRAPIVYDAAAPTNTKPVTWQFANVSGQNYLLLTLPNLTGMAQPVIDPTVTLQPDATAGKDTLLYSGAPTYNYGVFSDLTQSVNVWGLIEFDLSSIPSSAVAGSATLYLYHSSTGAALAWTITIYSIAAGNAAWIEGTKNGALAGAGEPCWNALAADGAGGVTTPWAGSAGLSTSGTDYEAVSIGSFNGNRGNSVGTEYSTALAVARVQGWFGAVNTNYGMKVTPNNAIPGIASSDHATPAYRPKLVVEYTTGITAYPFFVPFVGGFPY